MTLFGPEGPLATVHSAKCAPVVWNVGHIICPKHSLLELLEAQGIGINIVVDALYDVGDTQARGSLRYMCAPEKDTT